MAKKGERNKSAGVPRPFVARNLARLNKMQKYFAAIVKDMQRATGDDEWISEANAGIKSLAAGYDDVVNALECAPAGYKPPKRKPEPGTRKPRKVRAAAYNKGDAVVLLPNFLDKYPEDLVGGIGTKGTVLAAQPGGVQVFFGSSQVPAFVRTKHITAAGAGI